MNRPRRHWDLGTHWIAVLAVLAVSLTIATPSLAGDRTETCAETGSWLDLESGARMSADQAIASLADTRIVLLGESHTRAEHHRWQLHTLAGLHALRPEMTIGFEMFPRSAQPALDAWVDGERSVIAFLGESRWREVWGYDQDLYLPLFHFARQNRLPMIALNVDRELIRRVGNDGWKTVPEDAREGLTDPAPISESYRRSLAGVYAEKLKHGIGREDGDNADTETPDIEAILSDPGFARFVQAQTTWDRAMAEGLVAARRAAPASLVVGVMGSGHIEFGHGVPNQLAALGEDEVAILMPIESGEACNDLDPDIADLVFVVAASDDPIPAHATAPPSRPKARLGVLIEQSEGGVRIMEVVAGSVAEASGLAVGDIVTEAAGFPIQRVPQLVEIVQRQAPGTWLPLALTRDGEPSELIAKFPQVFQ